MPSIFDTLTWLEKTNNPFGVRCLDCRLFAQSMRSTAPNLNTVAQFNELRSSTGEQHIARLPPNAVTVSCNLIYPYDGQSEEGPLFVAEVMEDKWDIFFYDNHLYFARSQTGSLVFRAKMRLTSTEVIITTIEADAQISSPDTNHIVRQVDFLLKSHLYGWDIPHPLPADLPPEIKPIALYSFGQYGRRALFATYEDTLPIRLAQHPAPRAMMTKKDRVEGVLWGLAAGDRIGGPTHMAVRLAESLLEGQGFNLDDVSSRYLAWWRDGAFDTGPTTARVLELVSSGKSFYEASLQVDAEASGLTAGCNPVHRATPLAMFAPLADENLPALAMAEAGLTHRHSLAGDVFAAAVTLCRALIQGHNWSVALNMAKVGRQEETQAALEVQPVSSLKRDGFAPHVLATAIYFVTASPDFDTMLRQALEFAGLSNYCPVLAGSLGGARWGASSISRNWLRENDLVLRVQKMTESLADMWP